MPTQFEIRDMEPSDREAVTELMLALNRFENAISGDRATDRKGAVACVEDDAHKVRDRAGIRLVATQGSEVLGYICCAETLGPPFLRQEGRLYAYVHTLIVAEPARKLGIGAALMARAEEFARMRDLRSIAVGHLHGNEGAGRLYERLGFRAHYLERVKALD